MSIDFAPAARGMAAVVRGVTPDQLEQPTPSGTYSVADLLDHIASVTEAFIQTGERTSPPDAPPPPDGDGARLAADWQQAIPAALDRLVVAWSAPEAFDGVVGAGGFEMPATLAASIGVEELVIHGWDLARATGQPFEADDASIAVALGVVDQFKGNAPAYGDPKPAPADASPLEQVVALAGRDLAWRPSA